MQKSDKEKSEPRSRAEKAVTTAHSLQIGGRAIAYKATAGTLLIRDDKGKPDASVFYVAYTADGEKDPQGGRLPFYTMAARVRRASGCTWVRTGRCASSRRVPMRPRRRRIASSRIRTACSTSPTSSSSMRSAPAIRKAWSRKTRTASRTRTTVDNPNKRFWGTDQDIDAFGRFIARYITVNKRWNSPKFLFGESYGTPRSAGLAKYLEEHGIALNGVVLLSSILNYGSRLPGARQRLRQPAAVVCGDRLVSQQDREQAGDAGTVPDRSAQFRARRLHGRVEQGPGPERGRARRDRRAHGEVHRPERRRI